MGIVVALHFCPGTGGELVPSLLWSPPSLSWDGVGELLLNVDTFPPLRILRRFVPIGPGNEKFCWVEEIAVAMVLMDRSMPFN